jgi:hypothetical protein
LDVGLDVGEMARVCGTDTTTSGLPVPEMGTRRMLAVHVPVAWEKKIHLRSAESVTSESGPPEVGELRLRARTPVDVEYKPTPPCPSPAT